MRASRPAAYRPDQAEGDRDDLVDTQGIEGSDRIHGMKLFIRLYYRFVIVDRDRGGFREVMAQNRMISAERILTSPALPQPECWIWCVGRKPAPSRP